MAICELFYTAKLSDVHVTLSIPSLRISYFVALWLYSADINYVNYYVSC